MKIYHTENCKSKTHIQFRFIANLYYGFLRRVCPVWNKFRVIVYFLHFLERLFVKKDNKCKNSFTYKTVILHIFNFKNIPW